MRGAFGQVQQLVRTSFPQVEVVGSTYPLPAWKRPLVSVAQGLQMAALAVVISGDYVFRQLGVATPAWYTANVMSNRFGAGMGVWFVGNFLVTNLQNTGAFEVYYDGELVFSKLSQGRMPTIPELLGPLEARLGLSRGAAASAVGNGNPGGAGGGGLL